jgi:hypothetical protein
VGFSEIIKFLLVGVGFGSLAAIALRFIDLALGGRRWTLNAESRSSCMTRARPCVLCLRRRNDSPTQTRFLAPLGCT